MNWIAFSGDESFFACWLARCLVECEMYCPCGSDCSRACITRIFENCVEFMTFHIPESELEETSELYDQGKAIETGTDDKEWHDRCLRRKWTGYFCLIRDGCLILWHMIVKKNTGDKRCAPIGWVRNEREQTRCFLIQNEKNSVDFPGI